MSRVRINKADGADTSTTGPLVKIENVLDTIRNRAYELFHRRGSDHGDPVRDWLEAEREFLFVPAAELIEHRESFEIRLAVPGFKADQLEVTVLPTSVIVEGRYDTGRTEEDMNVLLSEFVHHDLMRRFELPFAVDTDHAHASLHDGVLKVVIRKSDAIAVKEQAGFAVA